MIHWLESLDGTGRWVLVLVVLSVLVFLRIVSDPHYGPNDPAP